MAISGLLSIVNPKLKIAHFIVIAVSNYFLTLSPKIKMFSKSLIMPFFYTNKIKNSIKFFFIGGGILTFFSVLALKNVTVYDCVKYGFLNGFAFTIFGYGNSYLADGIDDFLPWTKNALLRLLVSIIATIVYTAAEKKWKRLKTGWVNDFLYYYSSKGRYKKWTNFKPLIGNAIFI
jgi:hypothetical protein